MVSDTRGGVTIETLGRPANCKLIRVSARVENGGEAGSGVIAAISIRGDFFASPEEGFDRAERRLVGVKVSELGETFDALLIEEGVEAFGINGAGLAGLINAALENKAPPAGQTRRQNAEVLRNGENADG